MQLSLDPVEGPSWEPAGPWALSVSSHESTKENSTPQVAVPALHLGVPHQKLSGDELANLQCGSNAMITTILTIIWQSLGRPLGHDVCVRS